MATMRSWKQSLVALLVFSLAVTVIGILYLSYACNGPVCSVKKDRSSAAYKNNYDAYFAGGVIRNNFSKNVLEKDYDVNPENQDVIVFLHIQKTGGTTFGRHLVENLDVDSPCTCYKRIKKHCDCLTKNKEVWLFSRYSTGWKCGLHADWTELQACVGDWFQTNYGPKNRHFYYITLLRDPVKRFISEWLHVQRGATWKTADLKCNGRHATLEEVPFCFTSEDWKGATLEEFLMCRHNLAFNRQTRMLANLSKINCYNTTGMSPEERDRLMLESAKENLIDLAYFGLTEYQNYTQFLFEHTLNINFIKDFQQYSKTHTSRGSKVIAKPLLEKIAARNRLDIELYQFAKDLFFQRVVQAFIDEDLPVPAELKGSGIKLDHDTKIFVDEKISKPQHEVDSEDKNEDYDDNAGDDERSDAGPNRREDILNKDVLITEHGRQNTALVGLNSGHNDNNTVNRLMDDNLNISGSRSRLPLKQQVQTVPHYASQSNTSQNILVGKVMENKNLVRHVNNNNPVETVNRGKVMENKSLVGYVNNNNPVETVSRRKGIFGYTRTPISQDSIQPNILNKNAVAAESAVLQKENPEAVIKVPSDVGNISPTNVKAKIFNPLDSASDGVSEKGSQDILVRQNVMGGFGDGAVVDWQKDVQLQPVAENRVLSDSSADIVFKKAQQRLKERFPGSNVHT